MWICNAFLCRRRSRLPAQALLFVGRLVEKKGLRYLLKAMPEIIARFPQSHLTVVGDGPCRKELEKLSVHLGLRGRVDFLGALRNDELPHIYQQSGIIVFPSVVSDDGDREGFGLVLVEALGCGCAAVVTDLPAMMDIVADGGRHSSFGKSGPMKLPQP